MDDSPASLDSRRAILQRWLDEDLDETSQLFKRLEYLTDLTKKRPWQTCINEISKITYERSSVEDRNTLGISYNASGWIMSHPLLQTQIDAWSHLKELPPAEAENKPMVEWLWPFFSCHETNSLTPSSSGELAPSTMQLAEGFARDYVGHNAQNFIDTLENTYASMYDSQAHFGHSIPVIQSSGSGKSRMMEEVSHKIPVVTVVLRNPKENDGYPLGDGAAYEYFSTARFEEPEEQAAAFLGAWMRTIASRFSEGCSPREWLSIWSQSPDSGPQRQEAFEAVRQLAETFWARNNPALVKLRDQRETNTLSEQLFKDAWYPALFAAYCLEPAQELINIVTKAQSNAKLAIRNKFIFSIDECSTLNSFSSKPMTYPRKPDQHFISLVSLQRIITQQDKHIHDFGFWFTFLDTNSIISDFYPENEKVAPSARLARLKFLPPWCYQPFDLFWPPERELVDKAPHEVVGLEFIKKSGRPLWITYSKEKVIRIAKLKLFGGVNFEPENVHHVLAAFSQRIGLELGDTQEASIMASTAVQSHMRIMINLIRKGLVKTESPSEPILAIAASHALHRSESKAAKKTYRIALDVLIRELILKDLILDRGRKGELCARLLLVISIDLATPRPIVREDHVNTITLASLLTTMLGADLGIKSDQGTRLAQQMLQKYRDVHINVTHIEQQRFELDEIGPEYLLQLWCRGAGAQCTFNQQVINILIPAYQGKLNEPFNLSLFTYFVLQIKATERAQAKSLLETLTGPRILNSYEGQHSPWKPTDHLVMLMDLCAKRKKRERDSDCTLDDVSIHLTHAPARRPKHGESGATWEGYLSSDKDEPSRYCLDVRGSSPRTYKVLEVLGVGEAWEVLFNHTYNHDTIMFQDLADDMVEDLYRMKALNPKPRE